MASNLVRRIFAGTQSVLLTWLTLCLLTASPANAQTADAPAGAQPILGDLSHLVYTARSGLVAHAISPVDDEIVNVPSTAFEVATVAGAGVELQVNEKVVPVEQLGRRAELADGSVTYTYYGVHLLPGPNTVVLTPLGAQGLRGPSVTDHVWGPGAPKSIQTSGCPTPRADGRTPCVMLISVLDAWGHPAAPGATVRAAVTAGEAAILPTGMTGGEPVPDDLPITANSAAARPSIALVLSAGSRATIEVVPGTIPGRICIAAGIEGITSSLQFNTMAFARPPFVTGLASVGVGAVPGDVGADPTLANGTDSRRGRVALYGTGRLSGNAVGSLAYDTAGSLAATPSSGTFDADANDRPYATYGDASTRRNDALTQDKLYARIDDGFSNAMWGEFSATTGPPGAAGAVAMQVDGAKVSLGSATTSASAFSAANPIGYGRQILKPAGLATLQTLAHDNIVVGSETVTLVSRNRLTGVVVRQTTLQNGIDYTIHYAGGTLHFIDIPLPYDTAFNPQQLLVTYEYSAVGSAAKTLGGRLETLLGGATGAKLGLGYLSDETGASDFRLLTQNATGPLMGGSWSVSHASSTGGVPGTATGDFSAGGGGSTFRFAGSSGTGPYKVSFGYDATSSAYDNPFGDLQTPGLSDYHIALTRALSDRRSEVSIAYDHERNAAQSAGSGSSNESNMAASVRQKVGSRLTLHAGLTLHASDTTATTLNTRSAAASVAQADLGVDWKATGRLTLAVERDQNIGGFDATLPAQTTAQASWHYGTGRIYAQELVSDTPAQRLGSAFGIGSASRAFELGVEQKVGASTTVDSQYAVAGTGNGTDITSAIGVKERLTISKLLRGDAFIQRGVGSATNAGGAFTVYGLALGYGDNTGRFKATGSLQDRTGAAGGATWSLGAAGQLFRDFSLLASDHESRALGTATTDARIAIAWRPSRSDRGALFVGYERSAGNADVAGSQSGVASLDGVYRLTRRLELSGRYARKVDGDSIYVAGTSLIGFGARQQVGARFDIGIETRAVLAQCAGVGLHATAAEVGAMLGSTLRAAVGYNFGATADPTLAAAPTRRGSYTTLTTTINRIFGWRAP